MRIQHNIMAMNAYRNYNNNTSALSKNLEKLSSGYKINRAGDDAAGLAISEKMRGQITGLQAAQKNVKDGISFVKTAEGAMQEIEDMLNRMKYLATQSANGTYDDDVDRANLNKEVTALKAEIDRIADSANFNGSYMLKGAGGASNASGVTSAGSASSPTFTASTAAPAGITVNAASATANGDVKVKVTVGGAGQKASADTLSVTDVGDFKFEAGSAGTALNGKSISVTIGGTSVTATTATVTGNNVSVTLKGDDLSGDYTDAASVAAAIQGALQKLNGDWTGFSVTSKEPGSFSTPAAGAFGTAVSLSNGSAAGSTTVEVTTASGTETKSFTAASWTSSVEVAGKDGVKLTIATGSVTSSIAETTLGTVSGAGNGGGGGSFTMTLQIGDDAAGYNQLSVKIGSMKTDAFMGQAFTMTTSPTDGTTTYSPDATSTSATKDKKISDISIGDPTSAAAAIDVIKNAINYVSSVRGDLGALQNRLDHTANNLSVMTENIQDAESTIRDTDVAEEMMAYTKNNILIQSAQAMLAQANAVPQGVLQLLG